MLTLLRSNIYKLFIALFLTFFSSANSQPSFIKDSLDTYIQKGMKDWQIPGLSIVIIKDGKVVSHWAKAYRGIILKLLAQNSIKTINELMNMQIENLQIEEMKKQKNKTEIVYSIK